MLMHPGATSGSAHALLLSLLLLCLAQHASLTRAEPQPPLPTNTSLSVTSQLLRNLRAFLVPSSVFGLLRLPSPVWEMVALTAACGLLASCTWAQRRSDTTPISEKLSLKRSKDDPDPGLLKKHSSFETYQTSTATYAGIRTFYRPHPQALKLPNKPKPLPLLVFIHGLGGSLAQFQPLLTSLVNVGPCFGIDLPGCGLSHFNVSSWGAYSHRALVELLDIAISKGLERAGTQEAVLICHSMGCSLAVSLQTGSFESARVTESKVSGIIAICPKASLPTLEQVRAFQKILRVPTPIFDLWRAWDRRGGVDSASVSRFVGSGATVESKKLQLRFNRQSKTSVWRRMAWGATPNINSDLSLSEGLPGPDAWSKVSVPLFAIAGESDHVTKAEETAVITQALGRDAAQVTSASVVPTTTNASDQTMSQSSSTEDSSKIESPLVSQDDMDVPLIEKSRSEDLSLARGTPEPKKAVLKTTVLPSPASHGLLYDQRTYRTLSGLIQTFIANHIDKRLSLGWQLQFMKEANKWDVKNLAKWQAVKPVSAPIADVFYAMKTLREVDEVHSPSKFVNGWSSKLKAVIDISHESPVYNPAGLENGGIEYHKFPTVSKVPPTQEECREFIELVDQLRSEDEGSRHRLIGVHCHYGFNRTGFFICSYLIERERFGVQQAVDEFAARRPPGIRHDHFVDTLFVRYCVGLKRAPTL